MPWLPRLPLAENSQTRSWANKISIWTAMLQGTPGFFSARLFPPVNSPAKDPSQVGYYDISPLKTTLVSLVDFDLINSRSSRRCVPSMNTRRMKSEARVDDNRRLGAQKAPNRLAHAERLKVPSRPNDVTRHLLLAPSEDVSYWPVAPLYPTRIIDPVPLHDTRAARPTSDFVTENRGLFDWLRIKRIGLKFGRPAAKAPGAAGNFLAQFTIQTQKASSVG
jgi:hypothetical protein